MEQLELFPTIACLNTDAPGYIEAERLPPEWLPTVGTVWEADRSTIGSLADVIEALPEVARREWLALALAEAEAAEKYQGGYTAGAAAANRHFWDAFYRREAWEKEHGIECDAYGLNLRDMATGEYIVEQW